MQIHAGFDAYRYGGLPLASAATPAKRGAEQGPAKTGESRDRVSISKAARDAHARPAGAQELTEEEQQQVRELQGRDREVRAHEQAHKAAAGSLASGGPHYEYQRGPDGVQYAVGGHVDIALREGNTPQETLRLARQAQAAATAPAEPSGQDRKVASKAAALAAAAIEELAQPSAAGAAATSAGAGASDAAGAARRDLDGPRVDVLA